MVAMETQHDAWSSINKTFSNTYSKYFKTFATDNVIKLLSNS